MEDNLKTLALAKRAAERAYNQEFDKFWETVQVLSDKRFFEISSRYLDEILLLRFSYGRTNGVEQAAWELFRKALCKEKGYSGDEMIRFAKTYESMKERLYNPLFDVVKDKGDDSYSDLIDNLPLLGPKLFQAMESKEYDNATFFRNKVYAVAKMKGELFHGFFEFVWNGENHNAMSLLEAARKYLCADSVPVRRTVSVED